MKFYDIDISLKPDNEIVITQNNIYEDRSDCVILTKDMIVPVIHELESMLNIINEVNK